MILDFLFYSPEKGLDELEIPAHAFWRKLPPERVMVEKDEREEDRGDRRFIRGMYMRSTSDIPPKCKDIRNSYISPDWNDIRSIADMNELGDICKKEEMHHENV